jgi:hypothetical protein
MRLSSHWPDDLQLRSLGSHHHRPPRVSELRIVLEGAVSPPSRARSPQSGTGTHGPVEEQPNQPHTESSATLMGRLQLSKLRTKHGSPVSWMMRQTSPIYPLKKHTTTSPTALFSVRLRQRATSPKYFHPAQRSEALLNKLRRQQFDNRSNGRLSDPHHHHPTTIQQRSSAGIDPKGPKGRGQPTSHLQRRSCPAPRVRPPACGGIPRAGWRDNSKLCALHATSRLGPRWSSSQIGEAALCAD